MFKNKFKVIMSILFAITLCACVLIPTKTFAATGTQPVYVALGDSIPAGYGLSSQNEAYPTLLGNDINYKVLNLAKSGDTTSDLLSKLKTSSFKSKLASASLVTISIGGNDLMHSAENIMTLLYGSEEAINEVFKNSMANLETIVSTVLSLVPSNCIVLFENIYNPYLSFGYMGQLVGQRIERENGQIKSVCDKSRIIYVDVTSMNGHEEYFNTGKGTTFIELFDCHPTKEGHNVLFNLLRDAFYSNGGKKYEPVSTSIISTTESTSKITYVTVIESTSYIESISYSELITSYSEITDAVTESVSIETTNETTTTETTTETTSEIKTETEVKESTYPVETTQLIPISTEKQSTFETTQLPESTIETTAEKTDVVTSKEQVETTTSIETSSNSSEGKVNVWLVILCLFGGAAVLVGAYFLMYHFFKYILMKRKD